MNFEAGGIDSHYEIEGEGAPLVLIHGVGGSLDNWDEVLGELGGGFRVLRYDLRGLGQTTKAPGPYTLDDFAGDLLGLLDHAGFTRCHVAGFSLGGLIAQAFALAHPERVDRLVLISTVSGRTDEEKARVQKRLETVDSGISGEHFRRSVDRWFTPEFQQANPALIDRLEARNNTNDPKGYAAAYRVLAEGDLADALHRITAETLIVTGEHDIGSNPRMARLMHERIAGSKLVILPDLRHSLLVEVPALIAGLLRDFLCEPPRAG